MLTQINIEEDGIEFRDKDGNGIEFSGGTLCYFTTGQDIDRKDFEALSEKNTRILYEEMKKYFEKNKPRYEIPDNYKK